MKKFLVTLTTAAVVFTSTSAQATLLMYEPFDYPAGEGLSGSTATGPLGQTNANGQVWITRSPVTTEIPYDEARDVLITAGNLSYPGLVPSSGNSVRYGTNAAVTSVTNTMYTVAIDLPGDPFTSGSVYYSMIVHFHSSIPTGGARTSYATFSEDPATPLTDAGYGVITSSGTANYPLPASAWIRTSATTAYHLGAGKQNGDGLGTSASWPAWQSGTASFPNQAGNIAGTGQDWATIETNPNQPYFIVMKYTFGSPGIPNDDTVSMWVNPVAATLGYDDGEGLAGVAGGSYYSATNAYTTPIPNLDAYTYGVQSFMLIGNAQASTALNKSIDVSLDELRIGTTWADVTPVPVPAPQIISIAGAGTTSVIVTWTNVQIGTNYVLQYNTNLATTNWSDLAPVTAEGTTASQTNTPPSGDAVRFYRVLKP